MITQGASGEIAAVGLNAGKVYPLSLSTTTTLASTSTLTLPSSASKYLKLSIAGVSKQESTTGAQLIDMSAENWEQGGVNGLTGVNDGPNDMRLRTKMIPVRPGTIYTISRYNLDYCVAVRFFREDGAFAGEKQNNMDLTAWALAPTTNREHLAITTNADVAYVKILVGKGDSFQKISLVDLANIKIQLHEGTTVKPWESYTDGKSSPSLDCPQKIKSSDKEIIIKVTDGVDKEQIASLCAMEPLRGIDGYKDAISKKDGVWGMERKIIEYAFDGTESWTIASLFGYKVACLSVNKSISQYTVLNIRCSHAKPSSWSNTGVVCFVDNYTQFRFGGAGIEQVQTLATWKSWLVDQAGKGTPLTIVYALATPTWELLDDAAQASLNALAAYKGTTIITVDSGEVGTTITATYKKKGR